jgi:predicted Zn-dependent protease
MNDQGVFLEDAGRPEDAIRAYTAALDANPSNLVARINLSRVVRTLGRLETARIDASLVRYIEEMPGPVDIVSRTTVDGVLRDPAVLTARGLRRSAAGDAGLAVSDLLASLSLGASNDVAAAAAVRVLVSQGRSGEAALILEEAATRMPDSDILRMARSHMALAGHDPDAAERAMESTDPADPRRRLTSVLVAMARDDWKGADILVRDLLKESPANTEAVALSAVTGLRLGQPAHVRSAAATLQASGQRHPLVSISLAALLLDEKRTEEARQILEGLLVHQPRYRPARDLLIRMDQAAGRTVSMRDHIFEILRQNPNDPMANLQLAGWQGEAGRFDLAEAGLRAVLAQRRAPVVLNNLAWALRQQGKAADAVPLAEEAVRGNPGLASGWDTLAMALSDLRRSKEALDAVEKAAKLDPSSRVIRDHADALRAGRAVPRPR